MSYPPPGYDDESVVPQKRLRMLLGEFEDELSKIEKVFRHNIPEQIKSPLIHLEERLFQLKASADDLGSDYPFLVDRLIADYEHFQTEPSEELLEKLFSDVKSLQLLLLG